MFMTLHVNTLVGSKFINKSCFHTTCKVRESETEKDIDKLKNNSLQNISKQKLRQTLSRTQFVPLDNKFPNNRKNLNEHFNTTVDANKSLEKNIPNRKGSNLERNSEGANTKLAKLIDKLHVEKNISNENNSEHSSEGADIKLAKLIDKLNIEKTTKELNFPLKKLEHKNHKYFKHDNSIASK